MKIVTSLGPAHTRGLGQRLARKILGEPSEGRAVVLGLAGNLGGGKTTFLQGFARGLGVKEKISSPTFVILKRFKIRAIAGRFKNFYHLDCYRVEKPKELADLGFKEIVSDPQNIVAVEWGDRVQRLLPRRTLWIKFVFQNETRRKIIMVESKNG
ncbi:MAG: tRNA (adenosine(37)-N6)-threonylcarbamoyltransferase complex ATPase subunit type 1 TsaE [Candidatus Nealsonbacteria bacterium]|nr:tRNA (adenosine(37)-N6)-threonylcarbamoyltransferase complex ATPase subunit type 1 TsaE [Candidatus Nealsonbacteria bacterium]